MKRFLATAAVVSLLSTVAFAGSYGGGGTTDSHDIRDNITITPTNNAGGGAGGSSNSNARGGKGGAGGTAIQAQKLESKIDVDTGDVSNKATSAVKGSGNAAVDIGPNIMGQKLVDKSTLDVDSGNNIDIGGDSYIEAKNPANAPIVFTPRSNYDCAMSSGFGAQNINGGISGSIASESETCNALKLVDAVKELEPSHKGLQLSMLCTSQQAREGLEAHGIADKYCADKKTYLGLKPIVSGLKN